MLKLIEKAVVNHPGKVLLVIALVSLALLPALLLGRTDVAIESFLPDSDSALVHYNHYLELFGNDTVLVAFYPEQDVYSDEALARLSLLCAELESLPATEGTYALTDTVRIDHIGPLPFIRHLYNGGDLSETQRQELRTTVNSNPLFKGMVVSLDEKEIIIIIFLQNSVVQDDASRVEAVHSVEQVLSREDRDGGIQIVGSPLLKTEMSDSIRRDFINLVPIVLVVSLLVLWIGFRGLGALALGMASMGIALLWTMSVFFLLRFTLNMASIMLPSLVMALSLAQAVYIIATFRRTEGPAEERTAQTVRRAVPPCFLAAITTAAGFLSLAAAPVVPVRDFGVAAALGIMMAFAIAVLMIPAAFRLWPNSVASVEHGRKPRWIAGLSRISYSKGWVAAVTLVLAALSIAGLWRLRIETSPYEFFPDSHKVNLARVAYHEATGIDTSINILMRRKDGKGLDAEALGQLSKLAAAVKQHPLVEDTVSMMRIGEFLSGSEESFVRAWSGNGSGALREIIAGNKVFKRYLASDGRNMSFVALLSHHTAESIRTAVEYIEAEAKRLSPSLEVIPTGQSVLFAKMVDYLFFSQIVSVVLIVAFVTAVFIFSFRSVKVGLISLIPNITPILLTLGLMGWLDVPLNVATIMVSSISIGISVDATIHLVHILRTGLREQGDYDSAIDAALESKAQPVLFTSLLLTAAFLCYTISSFKPVLFLGLLTAFTMLGALIGDLVLLPAILRIFRPRMANKSQQE